MTDRCFTGEPDVTDVSGTAIHSVVDAAIDYDARTDPGGDLDQAQRRTGFVVEGLLTECHDVGVVFDENGNIYELLHPLDDGIGVPPRKDRRLTWPTGVRVDRAGDRDAHRADPLLGHCQGVEQIGEGISECRQDRVRAVGDGCDEFCVGEQCPVEPGDRGVRMPRVHGSDEENGMVDVEFERIRASATGRARSALANESGGQERIHPLGDGHPAQPRELLHVSTCLDGSIPDQLEDIPRSGGSATALLRPHLIISPCQRHSSAPPSTTAPRSSTAR